MQLTRFSTYELPRNISKNVEKRAVPLNPMDFSYCYIHFMEMKSDLINIYAFEMRNLNSHEEYCPGGMPAVLPAPDELDADDIALFDDDSSEGYKVVLYNDEFHHFDAVTTQIMIATGCERDMAEAITMRAHNNGNAIVVITDKAEAESVAKVLRIIALKVTVELF